MVADPGGQTGGNAEELPAWATDAVARAVVVGRLAGAGTAIWTATVPTFAEAAATTTPWFVGPHLRASGAHRRATIVAVARLLGVAHRAVPLVLRRAVRPGELARFCSFRPTARAFAVTDLRDAEGQPSPLAGLLPRVRPRHLRAWWPGDVVGICLTRDCETTVAGAIRSLLGVAGRAVVLDDGSCDGTRDVAEAAGAEVRSRAIGGDFSEQRNAAADAAGEATWCLHIDADEELGPGLAPLIVGLLPTLGRVDAVIVPRINVLPDQAAPADFPCLPGRIHRPRVRWVGAVHERLRWTRAVTLPVNGPAILHVKSGIAIARSGLRYAAIDPTPYEPWLLDQWRKEVRGAGEDVDDAPTAAGPGS